MGFEEMISRIPYEDEGQFSPDFDLSQIFIGREQQLDLFDLYLNRWKKLMVATSVSGEPLTIAPNPNNKIQGLVVLLYGRGGFGKSTLLKRYHEMALEQDWHSKVSKIVDWEFAIEGKRAIFNLTQGQQIDASEYFNLLCDQLAYALGKRTDEFREYQKAVEAVRNARKETMSVLDNLQKDDRYSWLRKIASTEVVAILRTVIPGANLVPGIDSIADAAKEGLDQAIKIGAEEAKQLYVKLSDRLKEKLDDYLEPALKLGFSLGRDLANFARNFPLLIFFDTYEEIDEGDALLRLVMAAAGVRVGWVLAGRDNLWAGLEQRKRSPGMEYGYKDMVPSDRGLAIDFNVGGVGAFTISDVVEYFSQISERRASQPLVLSITEEEASGILEVTQGVPLAIKIAARLYLETSDLKIITEKSDGKHEIVDEMARRYLLHTRADPRELASLYGLAMLRRSEEPAALIAALHLTPEQAKTGYEAELSRLQRRYSFIFTEKERPSLHQEVRHFLRLWLLEHRRDPEVIAVNERLKEAHNSVLKGMEESRQYSSLRDRLEDEEWAEVYLDLIEQQFWLDAGEGVRCCLPFTFAAAIYYRVANRDAIAVGEFFQSEIKQPYRNWWKWVANSLIYTSNSYPLPEELNGLEELAKLASQRCPTFPQPIPDYRTELEAALWWRLGEAYRNQDDKKALEWYEKALTRLNQLSELKEETAVVTFNAANTFYDEKKYTECKNLLNRAIELKSDFALAYYNRGLAAYYLKEHQHAIEDYSRALDLDPSYTSAYYNRGLVYHDLKEYQRAIDDYNRAIDLDPNKVNAYYNRGLVYHDLKEYQRAIEDYNHAIDLDPNKADAYYGRGLAIYNLKEYQHAIEDYSHALDLDPSYTNAYYNRGLVYHDLKEYQRAIDDYSRALDLDPNKADTCYNRGLVYHNLKEYQGAIEDYNRAIDLDPNYTSAYYNRGLAAYYLKEYQRAIEDYSRALDLDPNKADAYYNRGLVYHNLKEYQRAIEDYSRALDLDPSYTSAYYNRGLVYHDLKEYQHAIDDYSRAIDLDPNKADAYYGRGLAIYNLKEYQRAIEDYSRALDLDPNKADAYYNRGLAAYNLKKYQRAIDDYNHAIDLDPSYTSAYYNRGLAAYYLKEYQRAIEDYSRALDLDPSYTSAYYNRGLVYHDLKEYQHAIEDYNRAIDLDPSYTSAYYNRGLAYHSLKEYQRAIDDYSRALDLDPKQADAYYNRGLAAYNLKEYQRAIEDYNHTIDLDPTDDTVYSLRGLCYLWLGNIQQARDDYHRFLDPDSTDINEAWMAEWIEMGKERIGLETTIRLEKIARKNPEHYVAFVCSGIVLGLHNKLKEGLAELERAISLEPEEWDAYFWKGMLCAYLGRNLVAIEALNKALALDLPPPLLTPLYWLENDRPNFFSEYAAPLFIRYSI